MPATLNRRDVPNQSDDQKHRTDEPQQDGESGGSDQGGAIGGIGIQRLGSRGLTPQVRTSNARLNKSRAAKR
jgi:hypothetical protein